MTGRGCVIGQSGSGKSYLVGVIVEELCRKNLPFIVVDTEGEYKSLKGQFRVLWLGKDKEADADLDTDYGKLFMVALENSLPIIFDVSEVANKQEYVERALSTLYSIEETQKSPFMVIVEEADKFAPQVVKSKMNMLEELSVRGRKRGIGLLVATQRPASISKNVLAQCAYGFIGKLSIENDLNAVSVLLESRRKLKEIPSLSTGYFLPFGLQKNEPIKIKQREVKHIGATPELRETRELRGIESIIKELGKGSAQSSYEEAEAKGRKRVIERINVPTVKASFSIDETRERAERILRKQFIVFGRATEQLDNLEMKYLRVNLYKIRIPSGRNEFREYYIAIKGNKFVDIGNAIRFDKFGLERPIRLKPMESEVLRLISAKGKADLDYIVRKSGRKEPSVRKALTRLKKATLVEQKKSMLYAKKYDIHLLKGRPETSNEKVTIEDILNYSKESKKEGDKILSNAFPGSRIIASDQIYLPVYNLVLRHENKVRVFVLDGLSGKEIDPENLD